MRRILNTVVLVSCFIAVLSGLVRGQSSEPLPVLPQVDVTVLVENMAGGGPVLGEWGLSLYVDTGSKRVLIDCGPGQTLLPNARFLNVDLSKLDAIVISHNHSDHTGGLEKTLALSGPVDFFIHPSAFATTYWKAGNRVEPETMALGRDALRSCVRRLVETEKPALVCQGVMVTGQVPRRTDFEDTGLSQYAFLDAEGKNPSLILDDQAVFFRVPEGVVILLGCGHAGLVNTMRYVSELCGGLKIYAVMGGTHLINAAPGRLEKTIAALREFDVRKIMLSHCTGIGSFVEIAKAFPGRVSWPASGSRVSFGKQAE
jgi:7,8-dihydropterin-6-yl-methyl-4-(beta-D-ribofuranosyl)aminobenzene 5'-phosphate synthase